MSKRLIALSLLIILTAACDRAYVTPIPSATDITFTQPMATTTPTALFNFGDSAPTSTPVIVTSTLAVDATRALPTLSFDMTPAVVVTMLMDPNCSGAPVPHVNVDQQVTVTVEDWDKLKLRSSAKVASDNVVMELDQYTQLRILDGPVCAYSADTAYIFWKVAVIPTGEIGWVAEGDSSHYFFE